VTIEGRRDPLAARDAAGADRRLLDWASACATSLQISRDAWRGLRRRLPLGEGRRSFTVAAVVVTGVFLAGAWWLRTQRPSSRSLRATAPGSLPPATPPAHRE